MTKLAKILLIVLGGLVVFGVILYFYLQQNSVSADTATTNTKSITATNRLSSTDPVTADLTAYPARTPQYNRSTNSRTLIANYDNDISAQIKLADVALTIVSPTDGVTETPVTGLKMQYANYNKTTVLVTVPSLVASTIYHWTIKPSGSVFTDKVDLKFLTAAATGSTAPTVSGVSQASNGTISAIIDKAALCKIDLYKGTELNQTLTADLSYTGCSADLYIKKTYNVTFDQQTGSMGLSPKVKPQQTFNRMIELDSRDGVYPFDISGNALSVKATAVNSKGSKNLTANVKHVDPIGLSSVTQTGPNRYKIISDPIYNIDGAVLASTDIIVEYSDSASGAGTATYKTDVNGVITIPAYLADQNKTGFVDFTASYKPAGATITFPILNSKFLLVNY